MFRTLKSVVRGRPRRGRRLASTLLALAPGAALSLGLLAGCGQKGPLKLPAPATPATAASAPAR